MVDRSGAHWTALLRNHPVPDGPEPVQRYRIGAVEPARRHLDLDRCFESSVECPGKWVSN